MNELQQINIRNLLILERLYWILSCCNVFDENVCQQSVMPVEV